jgi:4-amino-4-deoxy-L-arabinose transferase-like glycosyltransferase
MQSEIDKPSSRKRIQFIAALVLICFAAIGIRSGMTIAFVGMDSPPDISASPDQGEYDAILQQLVAGNGYAKQDGTPTARRAAGMVFTLLPIYAASDGSYAAIRITLILLSSATCLLVGLTVARVFTMRTGLFAAAGLAVLPGHTYYAMHILSEAPFCFWLALAIYISVIAMQRQNNRQHVFFFAGLCWGMAVLTKPQFILLAPLALLAACAVSMRRLDWRPGLSAAVCLVAAALVVMPWYTRNAVVLDAPGLSTIGGYGLWAGNNELVLEDPHWRGRAMPTSKVEAALGVKLPEGEAASDAQAKAYAVAFMKEHRDAMPQLTAWKAYRLVTPFHATENRAVYWAQAISWILLAPLMFAGIVIALRRRPIESLLWLGPMVVTVGVSLVFFAISRYRDALLPAMVPFAAIAVDTAWQRWCCRDAANPAGSIVSVSDSEEQMRRAA